MPARILTLAAAIVAMLAAAVSTPAKDTVSFVVVHLAFGDRPALTVKSETISRSGVSFSFVDIGSTATTVSATAIDFAPGYMLGVLAPGSSAGSATLASSTGPETGGGAFLLVGNLTAEDPAAYATDPAAQACAPGPYLAVWKLTGASLGFALTLPLFVEHPVGDPTRIEIRFCPPPLSNTRVKPVTTVPMQISNATFELFGVRRPAARGRYESNAYITPSDTTGDAGQTVEARALEPVPHSITLRGRYDAKADAALLTGRVTQAGKPQARAAVEIQDASPTGPKRVLTDTHGTFTAHIRMGGATMFLARVEDATGPCGGVSTAPAGCASLTVTGTNTAQATVRPR